MAFVLEDRVRESSITTGTGPITLAGAPGGHQRFSAVMSLADTCWYAIVLPGSAWEVGVGTYSALNTLTRTTVLRSSNANAAVSFAAGTKDVFITLPASRGQEFPSGTLMLFQQTSAPVHWTKQTTHNDKALRVVSGAAGSGGTNSFSTVMAQTVVADHVLTIHEMPPHTHGESGGGAIIQVVSASGASVTQPGSTTTGSTGDGAGHGHAITMSISYVDLILASKD